MRQATPAKGPGSTRAYRQTARAEAVQETRRRIASAFWDFAQTRWLDDITLDQVAARSGVTVRTIIRQFGGKEGLVASASDFPNAGNVPPAKATADADVALDELLKLYEERGDAMVRALAQQLRHPYLSAPPASARAVHSADVAEIFASQLARLGPDEHRTVLDALVVATDVNAWKRLRRDMGRTEGETRVVVRAMVKAILSQAPEVGPV